MLQGARRDTTKGWRGLGSNNFRNSSYKEKMVRPVFPDYLSVFYDNEITEISDSFQT